MENKNKKNAKDSFTGHDLSDIESKYSINDVSRYGNCIRLS